MRHGRLLVACLVSLALRGLAAQEAPKIPAAFYDIEIRASMLEGTSSRMGDDGINRPRAAPPRYGNPASGGFVVPENSGVQRFIVTRDSLLFRNQRDVIEIATADFLAVDEVAGRNTPHIVWVRLRYQHPTGERELFIRRYNTRDQSLLRDALRAVLPPP